MFMGLVCGLLLTVMASSYAQADQAQYFYDELGRLIGVVDGQNNAAVYQYDAVGNLLKIERVNTTGGNVGIYFVTPGSSLVNKPVEIRGFGYTSPPTSNQVSFNGTAATVLSGTNASLIVTVPTGATSGVVTVTNANGVATSHQAFTVLVPPIVTGATPVKVPQGAVTRLLIGGFNLAGALSVQFAQAGLSASIAGGGSDTLLPINLTVGPSVPVGTYPFSVTAPGGVAQSGLVTVTVQAAVPSFEAASPVSVFNPLPAQMAPPVGETMAVSPSVSVRLP
jgi:YD repeat-containing protein